MNRDVCPIASWNESIKKDNKYKCKSVLVIEIPQGIIISIWNDDCYNCWKSVSEKKKKNDTLA